MNRQFLREDILKVFERYNQLKRQYGDQVVNEPEYIRLAKIVRLILVQQATAQRQQQMQQQQQSQNPGNPQLQMISQGQGQMSSNNLEQNFSQPNRDSFMNNGINPNVNRMNNNNNGNVMGNPQQFSNNPMMVPNQVGMNLNMGSMASNNSPSIPNQIPPQQLSAQPQQMNGPSQNPNPSQGGSAFTTNQFQGVKAQYQALRLLLKNPGPNSVSIPQNLIDFVTNERLAFPSGNYLPLNNKQSGSTPASQNTAMPIPNNNPVAPLVPSAQPNRSVQSPYQEVTERAPVNSLGKGQPAKPKQQVPPTSQAVAQQPKVPSFIPVSHDPKPPILLDEFRADGEHKEMIIPVDQPNVQVDCFEVPHLVGDDINDIKFNYIYSSQTRFQYPSLYPDGIDMKEIKKNREAYILLQIEQKLTSLKKQLAIELDESVRDQLETEILRLELLPQQKQLKGSLLSHVWFGKSLLPNSHPNFLAKFKPLSLSNVIESHELYKKQVHTLLQAQNKKHQNEMTEIIRLSSSKRDRAQSKRDRLDRLTNRVNSFHNQVAREEQKKLEKMAKQRLQALKLNDEEAYMKLLDHTKDTRITHLLRQTNSFLDSLAKAVQTQQKEANDQTFDDGMTDDERREKLDYYHVAHRIKEDVTKQPTILVGGTLKEYQMKGLQWMVSLYNNHLNGILADEMGLGKTIQTISLITYLVEAKKVPGPFLVIVPLSTITNWNLEFDKWAPTVKKITYKGTPTQRKALQYDVKTGNFQILLTTFEYIIKDRNVLSKVRWVHMIIDEGHRMKNANSKLSETLNHHYHTDNRLILTGTPLQNNLPELWALLNFVLPKIFNSVKSFDEWFNTPFQNTGGQDKIELNEEETLLVIRRLHKVLRPFLLRRLKKDVEKDLPNKVEKVVKCKMSSLQSKLYQQMLKHNILYTCDENGDPVTIKNANNQIMQLRKICNHPFVYEEVENLINPRSETNDDIWRIAGKFELLDRILPKFKKTGHRVLIFFQMTQIMDIMEDFLRLRNLKYMRLDGATKADDRTGLLKLFNAPNSEYFCFLLSTRAGGLGLNLQTADTVIIFDSDWNPHQDLQAQDRAHRIGQKNEVRILRLITEDSIEEMILERAHAKLEIDGKVIQAGKFDNKSTAEEQEAMLRALIEKEEERKQHAENDEEDNLDDDELNQVIARNDNELIVFKQLDEQRVIETREASYPTRLFSEQELPEIYKRDPATVIKKNEISTEDYGRGNRERKIFSYDDHLTEEQWLKQIEGVVSDSDDDHDSRPKRTARGRPRAKHKKVQDLNDFIVDDEGEGPGDREAKRPKSATPSSKSRSRTRTNRARPKGRKGATLTRTTPSIDPLTEHEREVLQTNVNTITQLILEYTDENGRNLSELFLVKPSKKLYPDYYVLIKNPLALDTVKKRISTKTYTSIRDYLEDIHVIFSNAKKYNEEGSIVYEDAKVLENLAFDKFKESVNLKDEEKVEMLNFTEFDETYGLRVSPLSKQAPKVDADTPALDKPESETPANDPVSVQEDAPTANDSEKQDSNDHNDHDLASLDLQNPEDMQDDPISQHHLDDEILGGSLSEGLVPEDFELPDGMDFSS